MLSRTDPERQELYALCESQGVALTVMKPYAGGALLDAQASPFGAAMTVAQCLHYCLTRPGVATVLTGAKNIPEMMEAIAYRDLPEEEKEQIRSSGKRTWQRPSGKEARPHAVSVSGCWNNPAAKHTGISFSPALRLRQSRCVRYCLRSAGHTGNGCRRFWRCLAPEK